MERKIPDGYLADEPCLVVAVHCAMEGQGTPMGYPELRPDGYATLRDANAWIRENLKVRKRTDYKRGERPMLKDLHLDGKAVVCVYGHYVFVHRETYWSFFANEEDEVVTVWELED